jgi:HAD superfamily hydrolase (TIGR01509 family)
VVNSVVKPERLARFDLILAGDDVKNKKPDPEIYNTARARLGISADRCLVIEDSMVGGFFARARPARVCPGHKHALAAWEGACPFVGM